MNESISSWSSNEFYEGKLVPHESVAKHTLLDIVAEGQDLSREEEEEGLPVITFVDTTGCDNMEEVTETSLPSTRIYI